jgi:hypothetical protein
MRTKVSLREDSSFDEKHCHLLIAWPGAAKQAVRGGDDIVRNFVSVPRLLSSRGPATELPQVWTLSVLAWHHGCGISLLQFT